MTSSLLTTFDWFDSAKNSRFSTKQRSVIGPGNEPPIATNVVFVLLVVVVLPGVVVIRFSKY